MSELKTKYQKIVIPEMKKKFGYKSSMAAPRILKAVINSGVGRIRDDKQTIEELLKILSLISGQKPAAAKSKKAIATFKTRIGMVLGYKVTLRGKRMYDFIHKLINASLPRVRDFRGLDLKSVDGQGNLTIGFKEHTAFPETINENTKNIFGLEISIATNAKSRDEAIELFKLLGFPFKKN